MDAKLRELERKAQGGDHDAALRLIHEQQRLINQQWQLVPCDHPTARGHHRDCKICGGQGFLRVCVSELNEYVPKHEREYPQIPVQPNSFAPFYPNSATNPNSFAMGYNSLSPTHGDPNNAPSGYGSLPNDLATHAYSLDPDDVF